MPTGTLALADLLAQKQTSAAEFGLDTIAEVVARDLAVHTNLVTEMFGEFAETSADRLRLSGSSMSGDMDEVDEFGRVRTQKEIPGSPVGFPLRLFARAIGWTRKWFQTHTPSDMAIQVQTSKKVHAQRMVREMKRAMYISANYTFRDRLVAPEVDLPVKRFVNADSDPIPDGPNGEVFDGATHTHYIANATLTAALVTSLIETVVEHGHGSGVRIYINKADETAFRALVGFVEYHDPNLILGTETEKARQRLDIARLDNRAIGRFGAAEVWVKPWAIANYLLCFAVGDPSKPLVLRTRPNGNAGLAVAAQLDTHPLHAEYMESEFGFGVWTRTNGAVAYFAGGAYVDPSI